MQLINDTLAELALAAPQGFADLAVYPLIAPPSAAGAGPLASKRNKLANLFCLKFGRVRFPKSE